MFITFLNISVVVSNTISLYLVYAEMLVSRYSIIKNCLVFVSGSWEGSLKPWNFPVIGAFVTQGWVLGLQPVFMLMR